LASRLLGGDQVRAFRKMRRCFTEPSFVFCSERKGPLTSNPVHKIVAWVGRLAELGFPVHPQHMLRHDKDFQLASKDTDTRTIQAYFGHQDSQHTVFYTQLSPARFKGFGKNS
jgi:type 1 fimbriae regulatory protein FimB/type 1 fimbriae regulatory protein FimE